MKKTENSHKENWTRTGKVTQELSHNKGGTITFAEEKSGHKTRLVPISYTTIIKPEKD